MTEIKIVFFDIDNTLFDRNKQVPDSAAEAIKKLQQKGILTAIATGRAPFMFKRLREKLQIHSFVSFNGSYVVDRDKTIFRNPIPAGVLDQLEKQASEKDKRVIFLNEQAMRIDGTLDPHIKESISSLKLGIPFPEKDDQFYKHHDIYQGMLFYSEDDKTDFLKKEPLNELRYIRWHPNAVDIIPQHGSKAMGIRTLLNKMGIPPEAACAFGDGNNDVEMLRYVGTGVAMGNAVESARSAADRVTRTADQDGIYHGLKDLGLI